MSIVTKAVAAGSIIGLTIAATLTAAQTWDPLKDLQRAIPIPPIPAAVNVHNYYPYDLFVVMDNDREFYLISSGGVVKFTKAHVGNKPTFRARKDSKDGPVVATKQVFLDGNKTVDFGR